MGDLLKAAELDEAPKKERFQKLYQTYVDTTFNDWDWDKEDIIKAGELFLGHGSKPQKLQWAAHMFADFDASGGMIEYFKKDKIDSDPELVQAFLIFAGCWIDVAVKASFGTDPNYGSAYLFKNKWSQGNVGEIIGIIQKVFFEYEKQRLLFPQVEASLKQFSFVNFKITLSEKINTWFKTNPTIKGLYSIRVYSPDGKRTYQWNTDVGNPTIKLPDAINTKEFTINGTQMQQLREAGFLEKEATYTNYSKGRTNDITVDENLENTNSAKFETSRYLIFTKQNENFVRQAYSRLGLSLLRVHAEAIRLESVQQLSLKQLTKLFKEDTDKAVNKTNENYISPGNDVAKGAVGYKIAQNILNSIRTAAVTEFLKKFDDSDEVLGEDEKNAAFAKAEETVRNKEEITGTDTDPRELSEEDIEAKQKFLKQCLLMSRLNFLAQLNIAQIESQKSAIHKKKPYKGRLYLIDEKNPNKDKSSIINKLLIPNKAAIGPFLDIKPSEHASLVPKIRLVKVYSSGSALVEHEFKFPKHSNSNRVNNLSSVGFDRGADFGVKEFSFSFDGTSPATAKNDITANLKLYFQSFQDFVEKKKANGGHRYVDLLILPAGDKGTKKGSGAASPLQFDPSYYRIRADVGWEADSAPNAAIKKAIQKINKTFYLNMVDHEIDIRDDGSVEINVSYRAYIETALKGTTLDALASRESREALSKLREEYSNVLESKDCNLEQLTLIRGQFLQIEENLRKNSFQSIIKRLVENDFMKYIEVDGASAAAFEKTGFIASPAVFVGDSSPGTGETIAEKSDKKNFTLNQNTFKDVKLKNSSDNRLINYFYLADLLYVILDCLYDPTNPKSINEDYISGTENFKFLLSSFQYVNVFNQSQVESVNIGNIPISVELFNEWFTENVIKPERTSYPVMYFIRDLTMFLITEILLESCFKNDLNKKLEFKTTSFLGKRAGEDCPISNLLTPGSAVLDVGPAYTRGDLPLSADVEGTATPVKDLFNYITIFAETTRGKTDKKGIKTDDEKNGIMHYQIGRDRGILKKIKFSKTDMQYIREARFFRHGNDGLMQLSAVYKISMDMVGNTIYYPGMEVFVDPRGLLGAGTEFDPTTKNSIANKLGFGGYHLVTSVKSSIGPGKFTTSVEALFSYNGDNDPKSKIFGSKDEIEIPAIDKEFINQSPQTPTEKTYCDAISDELYQQSAAIGYGFQPAYAGLGDRVESARESVIVEKIKAVEAVAQEIRGGGESSPDLGQEINETLQTSEPDKPDVEFEPGVFFEESSGRFYSFDGDGSKVYEES